MHDVITSPYIVPLAGMLVALGWVVFHYWARVRERELEHEMSLREKEMEHERKLKEMDLEIARAKGPGPGNP